MRAWHLLKARIRGWLHRDAVAGEIREELEFHVRMRAEQYERDGERPTDAARLARRRFGNLAVIQDRGYDVRGGGVIETVAQDLRYAIRLLVKQPSFSVVALITVALSVGLCTALFSVLDASLLRPLRYPHPEQLVFLTVEEPQPGGDRFSLGASIEDVRTWASSNQVLSDAAVFRQIWETPIVLGPHPERLKGFEITESYLSLHGVTPVLGRGIEAADTRPGAAGVVLIGYDLWQQRFDGAREAAGQTMRLSDSVVTIVGVLPKDFYRGTSIWRPMKVTPSVYSRRGTGADTYARLRPGVTREQAERELTAAALRQPGAPSGLRVQLKSVLEDVVSDYRTTAGVLTGAVALILILGCVNVAGLLLARGETRLSELAVRASIGASRVRLVRQLLTESLLLSTIGGLAGVAIAWLTLDVLVANVPMTLPPNTAAALNPRVLLASAALSLAFGLVFGLVPAARMSRLGVSGSLARGARRAGSPLSTRGGQMLIAAEVALALVLLVGAGLMVRSFTRMLDVDLGFDPDAILTMEVTPLDNRPASQGAYYSALVDAVRRMPGVAAAGAIDMLPLTGQVMVMPMKSASGEDRELNLRRVLPGYFEAAGIPLVAGRAPSEADRAGHRRVAVINQLAVKLLFPAGEALGHTFTIDRDRIEVVGVIRDIRADGPRHPSEAEVYQLFEPGPHDAAGLVVVVRPSGEARGLPDQLRRVAGAIGPQVLVERIRTGRDWLSDLVITPKRRTVLLSVLGALGLVLAMVGVFGVTAYAVARRTQEIGVRMAFGASPSAVVRAMVRDAVLPVVVGVGLGVLAAFGAARLISAFLFETTTDDPATFVATALLLSAAACVAAWIPARRAADVDPITALRTE